MQHDAPDHVAKAQTYFHEVQCHTLHVRPLRLAWAASHRGLRGGGSVNEVNVNMTYLWWVGEGVGRVVTHTCTRTRELATLVVRSVTKDTHGRGHDWDMLYATVRR